MTIERSLQIAIALMASLGTLLLGMGSGNVLLPVVAISVAISSLYLTDLLGWVVLNRNVASVAAVVAVCLAVVDFFHLGRERQLLALAYLLIYLQIVLMYQRKDFRVYWQLLMLSLLQVVVASALNFGLSFGLLLIVYMFVGLLALALFFIRREAISLQNLTRTQPSMPVRPSLLAKNEILASPRAPHWDETELRRGLASRVVSLGLMTLGCTFALFFLFPRVGNDSAIRQMAAQRVVGFNDTVRLGELGRAFENPQSVMRVWFVEPRTRSPYRVYGEPYFRGSIVNYYEKGTWSLRLPPAPHRLRPLTQKGPSLSPHVHQIISLEPLDQATVFSLFPAYTVATDGRLAFNVETQQIVRLGPTNIKTEFTVGTMGLKHGIQPDVTPVSPGLDLVCDSNGRARPQIIRELTDFPGKNIPRGPLENLGSVAREVLKQAGVATGDRRAKAKAIEQYLRDSGNYEYSLTAATRDAALDPIEDFVTNNRVGHCEYFASALALMLRSVDIPARIVIGFKGGEWNSLGGYYQVRQLHAHSWVEVYLDQFPAEMLPADFAGAPPPAAWLRLDPTPGSNDLAVVDETPSLADRARQWIDFADFLWSNYVVELNADKQQKGIYAPLGSVGEFIGVLTSAEFWKNPFRRRPDGSGDDQSPEPGPNSWLYWTISVLVLVISVPVFFLGRRLMRRLRAAIGRRREAASPHKTRPVLPPIDFYQRLERILKRHGVERPTSQTQHEFAVSVGGQLAECPDKASVAAVPRQVTEAFYRVRFGRSVLDSHQRQEIERSLGRLMSALKDEQLG